jgi:SulP family sulfate permease
MEANSQYWGNLSVKAMVAGVYCGFISVLLSVSYASLIFSGRLTEFISIGVNIALTSIIVAGLITAIGTSFKQSILQIDDDTAPVFALLIASVAATMPSLGAENLISNILLTTFVSTLLLGITLFAVAYFNIGKFIQYIPYSVMGGYFAAVGWLLCLGALTVATGIEITSVSAFKYMFSPESVSKWVPVLLITIWLHSMQKKISQSILLGSTIIGSIAIYFLIYAVLGNSPNVLMDQAHLIGPLDNEKMQIVKLIHGGSFDFSNISLLKDNLGTIASLLLISLLSIILCVSGLGLHTMRDIDLNHELKVSGTANVASAALGGMSSLPSLTISQLSIDLNPNSSRLVSFTAVAFCIVCFYFGMDLIAYTPRVVLAGLLFSIGLSFISEWLVDGLKKFGPLEYSVIPIILLTSIFFGFIQSIATGIIAAIVLFVIRYSKVQIIRYEASGSDLSSNLIRSFGEITYLKEYGKGFYLLSLQGYLFFGSSGNVQARVMEIANDAENSHIKYIILDFNQTQGIDASAILNLKKLQQQLNAKGIYLILTSLVDEHVEMFERGGLSFTESETNKLTKHGDLDRGIEWCEQSILNNASEDFSDTLSIFQRINEVLNDKMALLKIDQYLQKRKVKAGEMIAEYGEDSNELFFLQGCSASAYIIDQRGQERRVAGANMGTVFGEIGFFLKIPRTATVRADTSGYIYSLSQEALIEMEKNDPELAQAITKHVTMILSERLVSTTASLRSIM